MICFNFFKKTKYLVSKINMMVVVVVVLELLPHLLFAEIKETKEDLIKSLTEITVKIKSQSVKIKDEDERSELLKKIKDLKNAVEEEGVSDLSACEKAAEKEGLSLTSASDLCRGSKGSLRPLRCYQSAVKNLSPNDSTRLCGQGTEETFLCYQKASSELAKEKSIEICKGSDLDANNCFLAAKSIVGIDYSVKLCSRRASVKNVECLKSKIEKLSPEQAVESCRNEY